MNDFLTALALVLVIEGMVYAIMPKTVKLMIEKAIAFPHEKLRLFGVLMATVGVVLIWIIRRWI
ncbi:MAG: hypothetical protein FD153_1511 [Rhodospirillaceae bacterium]|nr:MAG: hypothetical protein FD153_1511 [Rhodospirillaceae bacterium]